MKMIFKRLLFWLFVVKMCDFCCLFCEHFQNCFNDYVERIKKNVS